MLLDGQNAHMGALQEKLDERWEMARLRRQLSEPALLVLLQLVAAQRRDGGRAAECRTLAG